MAVENGPVFTGSQRITGATGVCQICMNKSELMYIPDDDRAMCEDCSKVMLKGRENKERTPGPARPQVHLVEVAPNEEKAAYLKVIRAGITPEIVEGVIRELVEKKVFHFDIGKIIENDRWFSLMDLRRLALQVNPDFERPHQAEKPMREVQQNGGPYPVQHKANKKGGKK